MASLFERLNTEVEQFGRKAQAAIDEGKLRLEFFRLRRDQDDTNRELGRLFHCRERGQEVDAAHMDGLLLKLDQIGAELTRIERAIASTGGEVVSMSTEVPPTDDTPPEPHAT
ncbi:MAG: hypothetical protein ABJC74_15810 [Gemmatimonadota bacterium]